ncbi:MAG TPA: DinB family protein [Limnochordales bacterium]
MSVLTSPLSAETLRRILTVTYDRIVASLQDLSPQEAMQMPQGLAPIVWQVGHVALTDKLLLQRAGLPVEIPEGYENLFRRGTGGQEGLPQLDVVVGFLASAQQDMLALAREEQLSLPAPHPTGAYRTVAEGLLFSLYHRGYHHGKIMTLRALLGKPRLL